MGGVGSVNTVLLVSQDLRASFAANMVHGSQTGLINAPDKKFAFVSTTDGAWSTAKHEEIGVSRAYVGIAVGLRIGEHVMTITKEIGNQHYTQLIDRTTAVEEKMEK